MVVGSFEDTDHLVGWNLFSIRPGGCSLVAYPGQQSITEVEKISQTNRADL